MKPARLREIGGQLYGYGWQTRMAQDLSVNPSTVRRWVAGDTEIPGPVVAALECWMREGQNKPNHRSKRID